MRTRQLLAITFLLLGACGGETSGDDPSKIHTDESCKVDSDCKKYPGHVFCQDPRTAVRYEIPTCGADQRCSWGPLEDRCNDHCEEGYCITAGGKEEQPGSRRQARP
jgi:hypothetical protein